MSDNVIIKEKNGILDIIFNRPDRKNAINRDMFEKLLNILKDSQSNPNLKAIFLSGTGDAFSAGGDVKDMAQSNDNATLQQKTISLRRIMEVSKLLHENSLPTIAVVNGVAAGAGLALALACDMRIASEKARFTTAFSKVGFSGDFGGSFFLTKIIGTAKARELYYFSDIIDADTAFQLNLVNFYKKDEEMDEFTDFIKDKFRNLPPIAIKYMKQNLNNAESQDLDSLLNDEATFMMICSETEDHKNAVKAFVNKEKPKFVGK